MPMNKKILWIFPLLLLISIIPIIIKNMPEGKFYLEDKYYGKNQFVDITSADLNNLIKEKESFALFVYQPACVTSADFEQVLYDFMETNNIQIYKISFSDLKETEIKNTIKYYPSFAVFNKGKMVDYLDANSDEDLKYYKSKEGFTKWFQSHVIIKETKKQIENQANSTNTKSTSTSNSNNNINEETKSTQNQNINLENVTRDNNKVNIYFFWGSTCPHCKEEFAFFDEIEEEYGKYYNLYTFEVWQNYDNKTIMNAFASALNEEAKGVPYTIVGDVSFTGFGDVTKEKIIDAIKTKHQNSHDIYFDKIKLQ